MGISQESIDKFKELYKKEKGEEITDSQASEMTHQLVGFFDVLWRCSIEDQKRKDRLKNEPDGFPVDGHYSCIVCKRSIDPSNGWYDKYAQKCFLCRDAIRNDIVPPFVTWAYDSFFRAWQVNDMLGIKTPTTRKLVREGKLVARIIPDNDGKPYEYIFLKKENPELAKLDPHRHTAARKSYDRYHHKRMDAWGRDLKQKMLKEREAIQKRRKVR